jgi:hypothetical protein
MGCQFCGPWSCPKTFLLIIRWHGSDIYVNVDVVKIKVLQNGQVKIEGVWSVVMKVRGLKSQVFNLVLKNDSSSL